MSPSLAALSRMVSHALRHEPWLYELELDEEGWVEVGQLLDAIHAQGGDWATVARIDLQTMIESSAKTRHELVGNRIRALYGHSLPRLIKKTPGTPPTRLYHGTAASILPVIWREGLRPMGRQYVHLSADAETAHEVGRRKDPHPVVLAVDAAEAQRAGVAFYEGNELVWLADAVPPAFLNVEDL